MIRRLQRAWLKFYCKIVKIPSTPRDIALGAMIGAIVGHMPIMGFQIMFLLFLNLFIRFNIISASLFTLISNPVSAPFLYPFLLWIGTFFYPLPEGMFQNLTAKNLLGIMEYWFFRVIDYFFSFLGEAITHPPIPNGLKEADLVEFLKTGFISLWVGCLITGCLVGVGVYFFVLHITENYQKARLNRSRQLLKKNSC
ncbi:DUF2062 domain-containing protein [Candidatus Riflebacteria bacterium]